MSPSLRKKLEQVDSLGTSPFPDYARPTPEECETVLRALEAGHGGPRARPEKIEYRANGGGSNCGLVPDVLDALIRTILSQNTTNKVRGCASSRLTLSEQQRGEGGSDGDVRRGELGGCAQGSRRGCGRGDRARCALCPVGGACGERLCRPRR